MKAIARSLRSYDHRLRRLVHQTGDASLAVRRGIPRSTARGWTKSAPRAVVSLQSEELGVDELRLALNALQRRHERVLAILRLLVVLVKSFGLSLKKRRLPDDSKKRTILRAIENSRGLVPFRAALRLLGLSQTRYRAWHKLQENCALEDVSSCPITSPQQLTGDEVRTIKAMVLSDEYRHVPTCTLAILAQRLGKVFASPSTWYRLVRLYKWRRPRVRIHPAKAKVGIRATRPNEIWHVDTTLIRLLDGTRAYLHAVIDNFSRKILAWRVAERFDPANTVAILVEAAKLVLPPAPPPTVLADSGGENVNAGVDELIAFGTIRRLLAQTEIAYSNSMIESFWRALKHQWLFLNSLKDFVTLQNLVAFYVEEHNTRLPHSAFHGQTPDEMYLGTGTNTVAELEAARLEARERRFACNRAAACGNCSHTPIEVRESVCVS